VASSQGNLYVFGGLTVDSERLNDCFVLHTSPNLRWENLSDQLKTGDVQPNPRSHHSANLVKLCLSVGRGGEERGGEGRGGEGIETETETEGMLVFGG
jgi:hypothetical protein